MNYIVIDLEWNQSSSGEEDELFHITKKLIHLKMEQLEKGKPFTEVMKRFREWCGTDYVFCTWGPLDLMELQRNIRYYGMEALGDAPIPFLDVQKLFSIGFEDRKISAISRTRQKSKEKKEARQKRSKVKIAEVGMNLFPAAVFSFDTVFASFGNPVVKQESPEYE